MQLLYLTPRNLPYNRSRTRGSRWTEWCLEATRKLGVTNEQEVDVIVHRVCEALKVVLEAVNLGTRLVAIPKDATLRGTNGVSSR
jgi:hypothetical protein